MRRYISEAGTLSLNDGDYGMDKHGKWYVRPPGQHAGGIGDHEVEEHEDGTITVSPSIVLHEPTGEFDASGNPILKEIWHGHLIEGIFKSC